MMSDFQQKVYPVRKFNKPTDPVKSRQSKFSNGVYEIVKKIPKGEVLTYKEVAKLAGKPRAWRAVGNALSKNKNPRIPCYRVIRSDAKVGGYSKGINKKIELLRREGFIVQHLKLKVKNDN